MDNIKEYFLLADIYFIKHAGKLLNAAYDATTDTIDLSAVAVAVHKSRFMLNAKRSLKKFGNSESLVNSKSVDVIKIYILKTCSKRVTSLNRKIYDDVTAVQTELRKKKKSNRNYFKYYFSQRLNVRFETILKVFDFQSEINLYRHSIAQSVKVITKDMSILTNACNNKTLYTMSALQNLAKKVSIIALQAQHKQGVFFATDKNKRYLSMMSDIDKIKKEILKMYQAGNTTCDISMSAFYAQARRKGYVHMCEQEKQTQGAMDEIKRTKWDKDFSDVFELMLNAMFKKVAEQIKK